MKSVKELADLLRKVEARAEAAEAKLAQASDLSACEDDEAVAYYWYEQCHTARARRDELTGALADELEKTEAKLAEVRADRDRIKAFLSDGGYETIQSEQAFKRRALAAEGKLAIRTMRLNEAEQLLGLARSCLAGALGDDIDSYFA